MQDKSQSMKNQKTQQVGGKGGVSMQQKKISSSGVKRTSRIDFLQGSRKPSSMAFPLMEGQNMCTSNDELFEFENKLRDIIAELTKPIYDKIQDILNSMRQVKGSTDEVSRKANELEFQITTLQQMSVKVDDQKRRLDDNRVAVEATQLRISHECNQINNDFDQLRVEFRKEQEQMRVTRKTSENLKDSYCKVANSVASERQRNLMYIEKAKRGFVQELFTHDMKIKLIDSITKRLDVLENRFNKSEEENHLTIASKLVQYDTKSQQRDAEMINQVNMCLEKVSTIQHQVEMVNKDHSRMETELQNTDFFLNKVQPINSFTTMLTLLREVIDDESRLQRLTEIQKQFFQQVSGEKLMPTLQETLDKHKNQRGSQSFTEQHGISPHFQSIKDGLEQIAATIRDVKKELPVIIEHGKVERFEEIMHRIENHRKIAKVIRDHSQDGGSRGKTLTAKNDNSDNIKNDSKLQKSHQVSNKNLNRPNTPVQTRKTEGMTINISDIQQSIEFKKSSQGKNSNRGAPRSTNASKGPSRLGGSRLIRDRDNKTPRQIGQHESGLGQQIDMRESRVQNRAISCLSNKNLSNKLEAASATGSQQTPIIKACLQMFRKKENSFLKDLNTLAKTFGLKSETDKCTCMICFSKKLVRLRSAQLQYSTQEVQETPINIPDAELEIMKNYDVLQEQYDATEQAMAVFGQQFSIKKQLFDQVTAFKSHIIDTFNQNKQSQILQSETANFSPNSMNDKLLSYSSTVSGAQNQTRNEKQKSKNVPNVKMISFRGKIQSVEVSDSEISNLSEGFTSKHDLLKQFIDQQKKINELHRALTKNIIEDRAQQFDDEEIDDYESEDEGRSSSQQDELEAMDSVNVDDLKSGLNSGAGVSGHNFVDDSIKKIDIAQHRLGIQEKLKVGINEIKKSYEVEQGMTSRRSSSQVMNTNRQDKESQRLKQKSLSKASFTQSKNKQVKKLQKVRMSSNMAGSTSGNSQVSKRDAQKGAIIMMKDLQKNIDKKMQNAAKELSHEQRKIVENQIQQHTIDIQTQFDQMQKDFNAINQQNVIKFEELQQNFSGIQGLGTNIVTESFNIKKEFNDQRERYDVCIRRLMKTKRHFIKMHDVSNHKFDKFDRIQKLVLNFLSEICYQVNQLITAQGIDVSLYVQDEMDRQHTFLYGINEEAGKPDLQCKSPLQINKNCMSCSGNANYIKKAFKLACLQYQSSLVQYDNQKYSREALFNIRYGLFNENSKISLLKFKEALMSEELKLQQVLESEKQAGRLDSTIHIPNSNDFYATLGFNRPDTQQSFQTIPNNSTMNLQTEPNIAKFSCSHPDAIIKRQSAIPSRISEDNAMSPKTRALQNRRGMSATLARKTIVQLNDENEQDSTVSPKIDHILSKQATPVAPIIPNPSSQRTESMSNTNRNLKIECPRLVLEADATPKSRTNMGQIMTLRRPSEGSEPQKRQELNRTVDVFSGSMPQTTKATANAPFLAKDQKDALKQTLNTAGITKADSATSNFFLSSPSNVIFKRQTDRTKSVLTSPQSRTVRNRNNFSKVSIATKGRSTTK